MTSSYRVIFAPEAKTELLELYDFIADTAGETVALGYINRIEEFCLGLRLFPKRGTIRDDIRPGLRIAGFERRVAIAFHIKINEVVIDRILYGGREL